MLRQWRGECSLVLSVPRNPSSDASLLRACCWPGWPGQCGQFRVKPYWAQFLELRRAAHFSPACPGPGLAWHSTPTGWVRYKHGESSQTDHRRQAKVSTILPTVFTSRCRRLLNGFGQWEGSRHGLSQPRPCLASLGTLTSSCSFLTSADTPSPRRDILSRSLGQSGEKCYSVVRKWSFVHYLGTERFLKIKYLHLLLFSTRTIYII